MTTHRLVWLSPAGSPCRACGLSLACVERAAPKPRATFGSRTPRVLVTVHVSATGAVTAGARHGFVYLLVSELKAPHYFAGPGHAQATLAFAFRCVLLIVARAISTHNELWANTGFAEESLQMSCCRHYSRYWHAKLGRSSHCQCWRLRQGSCAAAHRRQPLAGHSCAPRMWALQASCAARRLRSRLEAAAWMRHSPT